MGISIVTGANRGIGLELATQLKARGATVVAVCRRSSPALDALGVRVEADADITEPAAWAHLAERFAADDIDLLIHNAGMLVGDALDDVEPEDVRAQFELNAVAPLFLTKALMPRLRAGAKVVLITSRMGSIGDNGSGSYYGYRMSKAALNAAGVSLARDLAPEIRVNGVAPGPVMWPDGPMAADVQAQILERTALKRIGSPEDVAKAVLFFVKDAPYVTGQVLPVDGGRTVGGF